MRAWYNIHREYENKINEIRVEKGLSLKELGRRIGIGESHMWQITQGYNSPFYEHDGHFKSWATKLEKVLGYDLTEIFPREICSPIYKTMFLTNDQIISIAHSYGNERNINKDDLQIVFQAIDKCLDERQKKVVKLIFYEGLTYEKVGDVFKLTRERIRQILAKSLRLIREYYARQTTTYKREVRHSI